MKNFHLSSLTKYLRFMRYGDRLRPTRDWLVLTMATFVLLLASIGWNIWLFVQIEHGQAITSGSTSTNSPTKTISVTGVQTVFQARATEETNYQNNYHFVDPSRPGS